MANDEPITLFTQDGCIDSARVRTCLALADVPFIERNVTHEAGDLIEVAGVGAARVGRCAALDVEVPQERLTMGSERGDRVLHATGCSTSTR